MPLLNSKHKVVAVIPPARIPLTQVGEFITDSVALPAASVKDCLGVDVFQRIEVHALFEEIIKTCKYEKWFFGKCHIDKHIPVKFYAVFNNITPLIK